MKKISIVIGLIFLFSLQVSAQADRIIGFWLTDEGESQIEIFKKSNGKYYGKIVWLEEPYENGKPKVDDDNPDENLRNRPILGLELLKGFTYDAEDKEWENGTIYDPESGKTYDCYMWFEGYNNLKIKGYVMGMRFLGRKTTWTRDKKRQ
jgi:uncharacterized protein (DUF2147 family)